uniref:dihydroxyacetone kinase phosphoryl donor subunit DhaM n=1 Tax=Pseudonocardia nigra TaxID=1921578 RepID=UPI0027E2F03B
MTAPVGLVVVSHSRVLAEAAVALAREMAPGDLPIEVAAGLDDGTFGTDAVAIGAAIGAADGGAGVVVLMDLGSAVLSAELALDLLDDPDARDRVLLCPAPLVEGLVVAAVTAAGGAGRAEVAAEAAGALGGKQSQLGEVAPGDAPAPDAAAELVEGFTVANPHGLHARPAARLVGLVRGLPDAEVQLRNATTGSPWAPATSLARLTGLAALEGHRVEVTASGPGARVALDAVLALAARRFDEATDTPARRPISVPESPGSAGHPLPASPGIAVGPKRSAGAGPVTVPDVPAADPASERADLDRALAAAAAEIRAGRAAAARELGPAEAEIFDAHLLLLDDPDLLADARTGIDAGAVAARAWADAAERAAAALDALPDPYLAARAADVRAVADQVLRALVGAPAALADPGGPPGVLVAPDLTPAQAAALDPDRVAGVVLAAGSPTAHSAILLRARSVPAVLGAGRAVLDVGDGTPIALDGTTGELAVDPDPATLAAFRERAAARAIRDREARSRAAAPAVTRDGVDVLVGANVGSPADATAAAAGGADLVGLLRTE